MPQNMAQHALNVAQNAPKRGIEYPRCGTECPVVFTDILNYIQLNSQYDRETDPVPNIQFTIIFKSHTLFFLTPLFDIVHPPGLRTFCVPV